MEKQLKVTITGVSPLVMHNGLLVDHENPYVRKIKAITAKKTNKTDADKDELAALEWFGGLYMNEAREIIVPTLNIEGAIAEAAKKLRKGKSIKSAAFVNEDSVLDFPDKGKPMEKVYDSRKYQLRVPVVVTKSRVMRVRPLFAEWKAVFTITYFDDLISESDMKEILHICGRQIGIGDFRPKYGRFEAKFN